MKRFLAVALAAVSGLAIAGTANALPVPGVTNGTFATTDYPAGAAANGILGSRHNLGALGSFITTNAQNGTTEICVFCHTPHHTNTSIIGAPLWNRTNMAGSYTAYGATIGGSNVTSLGSVSLACLSCHDGVTTFDNLVNAPGAGSVNTAGASQGWVFMDEGNPGGASSMPTFVNGAGDQRLNIGSDLSNDHPVSVTYSADRASLRPTNTIISSINLTSGLQASATTAFGGNLTQNRWAVKGYISDTATIADLLRTGNKIECASCHDPHFKNLSWDEVDNLGAYAGKDPSEFDGLFLRRVGGNTGSGVCRTCHNK